jgi:transcriptional regulator with XRE-family HTH domain
MITAKQVAAARALLGLSQENLARLSGLSRATLSSVENDYDSRVSSLREIERALTAQGIVFTRGGGIAQRMEWGPNPPSPEIRKRVLSGLNDARRARGNPLLIDEDD